MVSLPQSDPIGDLLKRSKTIAVVGLSSNPLRPSHGVSAYMQSHGYRIVPVNPEIDFCMGEKAYASLLDVPEKIEQGGIGFLSQAEIDLRVHRNDAISVTLHVG